MFIDFIVAAMLCFMASILCGVGYIFGKIIIDLFNSEELGPGSFLALCVSGTVSVSTGLELYFLSFSL